MFKPMSCSQFRSKWVKWNQCCRVVFPANVHGIISTVYQTTWFVSKKKNTTKNLNTQFRETCPKCRSRTQETMFRINHPFILLNEVFSGSYVVFGRAKTRYVTGIQMSTNLKPSNGLLTTRRESMRGIWMNSVKNLKWILLKWICNHTCSFVVNTTLLISARTTSVWSLLPC